jgi:hypothetical protein
MAGLYLGERYVPGATDVRLVAGAVQEVRRLARRKARDGPRVRVAVSVLIPSDEVCFLLFEAPEAAVVHELTASAGFSQERLTPAVDLLPIGRGYGVFGR